MLFLPAPKRGGAEERGGAGREPGPAPFALRSAERERRVTVC